MFANGSTGTTLELVNVIASALTPFVVLILGYWINRRLTSMEHLQWASQKLIEKRLAVFDELAPLLNDLMCYFAYIGVWKEFTPAEIIKLKRCLDRIAHINAPLFPSVFLRRYNAFINLCYKPHQGWGLDAKLRTQFQSRRKVAGAEWKSEWDKLFDSTDCPPAAEIRQAYAEFVALLAEAVGVGIQAEDVLPGNSRIDPDELNTV